ncbi:KH domain-containing protein [Geminocystis sp. CENA526]|uniref:KH domain-containing protein n=1 Tax=Geminocystis sp. CENA526 TaxID=1355871 RepID=UPI003D6FE30A
MLNNELNGNNNGLSPDYDGLVRFLIEPLLESPELLNFDCEQISSTKRVWIRLAFEENDKGKIYGRGGRNIQALRTVLQTAAQLSGDTLYLEIYEDEERTRERRSKPPLRQAPPPRPAGHHFTRRPIRRSTIG